MSFSPMLLFHICAGTLGLLSGAVALSFRKGSQRHRVAGNVFFISLVGLGLSGAYMGFMKSQVTNVLAGVITSYLVATAWSTARHREGETGIFDWIAFFVALTVGASAVTLGLHAANSQKDGDSASTYFLFGFVALLSAAGDVRMLARGGVFGVQRLVRHLWRMCFGLFVASASIFLARPHLFPAFLRKTNVLLLLGFLPLILMVFWLLRVRFAKAYKRKSAPRTGDVFSLPT
jgi:Predicted membrane protein (DUF2306)